MFGAIYERVSLFVCSITEPLQEIGRDTGRKVETEEEPSDEEIGGIVR